jgi:hypothetical protein
VIEPNWWDPVNVTGWNLFASEPRGRRPKTWLIDPAGVVWLRKSPPPLDPARPHTARRSEPAVEVFALELAIRTPGRRCQTGRLGVGGSGNVCNRAASRSCLANEEQRQAIAKVLDIVTARRAA